jgi:hypothetical protein
MKTMKACFVVDVFFGKPASPETAYSSSSSSASSRLAGGGPPYSTAVR